jgi:hypothetical protein
VAFIKKKIGSQIRLDEDLSLGGLGIHQHPRPTELAQHPFSCILCLNVVTPVCCIFFRSTNFVLFP